MNEILSSGGGTQSNCILSLICAGLLPAPDFIVIADTGRERPAVWAYLDEVARPALKAKGIEIHRIMARDYGYAGENLYNKKGTVLIPAYSDRDGEGKLTNFCTTYWKIEACDNWLSREQNITRGSFKKWIGFSLNESRRAVRMMAGKEYQSGLIRFPLIHDVPLTRSQAIKVVERFGWPTPPRSACWMCPNQSDSEWRDLKENWPKEFQQAVELENELRQRDANIFLHESRIPLSEVDFYAQQSFEDEMFNDKPCSSGMCFT